jgi:acyl-CoA dehydrogenase
MIEWSAEQQEMRAALRDFVTAQVEPNRDALESGEMPPYDILRAMFKAFGLDEVAEQRFERSLDTTRDPRDRRRDPDQIAMVLLPIVELSRSAPGMVTAMGVSSNLAPGAILKQGTLEQKRRWALDLMTMRKIGAWAITEAGSGSDAFGGMRSTARRAAGSFVLNGSKTFITNGPYADTVVFICRLAGETEGPGPVLTFVLDRGLPGFTQSKPLRKMGQHSSPTGELFLDDVQVGMDRLLGGEQALEAALKAADPQEKKPRSGSGGSARGAFASERASMAATALGIIERCLELSVKYARNRVQFGRPIGEFQLIQEKLARMEVARLNVQNLLFFYIESLTSGRGVTFAEASSMKLYSARAAVEVAMEAVQVHGGNGYMSEYHVEQLARDAKVLQIYAGTDEMQIRGIARELLRS